MQEPHLPEGWQVREPFLQTEVPPKTAEAGPSQQASLAPGTQSQPTPPSLLWPLQFSSTPFTSQISAVGSTWPWQAP